MRSRAMMTFVLATITVVALSGCIGGDSSTLFTPPTVTIDQVTVPASMTTSEPEAVLGSAIVPATGSLPWMIGGSLSQPGKPAVATVWTSPDGSRWTRNAIAGEADGSFVGSLDASDTLAAMMGYTWVDGATRSVVWTSTDRVTWTEVPLPDDFAKNFYLFEQSVTGSTAVGFGADNDGVVRGIRITKGEVSEFELPAVTKGDELGLRAAVADGNSLVIIADPGPVGDPRATVSYVSDDKGKTWSEPTPITDSGGFVSGITRVDDGFVATGGGVRTDDANSYGAAAWSSREGSTWSAETVPSPPEDSASYYYAGASAWFGAPLANRGVVTSVLLNSNSAVSGIYQRAAGGQWSYAGQSTANQSNGLGGSAVSMDGSSSVGLIGESGYARAGILSSGTWADTLVIAPRSFIATAGTVYPAESTARLTLGTPTFTVDSGLGWRNSTRVTLTELDGDSLVDVPWNPARAADLTDVQLGSDDSGAEVLLGSSFPVDSDTILIEGWFRDGPDAEWTPATGFDASGATSIYTVDKIGGQWVATGKIRASSETAAASHGVIWVSNDGLAWSKPAGEFGNGTLETSVNGVCTLSDGSPVAVGWVEASGGKYRTAVWKPVDGTWTRTEIGRLGTISGSASSCATGDEGVVLAGYIGGRDTLQQSGDGTNWTEVFRADRGIGLGGPVAVPGGFAAPGSLTNDEFSGPVVWLSPNGTDWFPVTIESFAPGATSNVAPYGDDLIVTMSSRTGHPVSIIRNIEKIIDDNKG